MMVKEYRFRYFRELNSKFLRIKFLHELWKTNNFWLEINAIKQ